MNAKNEMSNEEVFDALSLASKQYEHYLEIKEVCTLCAEPEIIEDYHRDINHPLGLVIHGDA